MEICFYTFCIRAFCIILGKRFLWVMIVRKLDFLNIFMLLHKIRKSSIFWWLFFRKWQMWLKKVDESFLWNQMRVLFLIIEFDNFSEVVFWKKALQRKSSFWIVCAIYIYNPPNFNLHIFYIHFNHIIFLFCPFFPSLYLS